MFGIHARNLSKGDPTPTTGIPREFAGLQRTFHCKLHLSIIELGGLTGRRDGRAGGALSGVISLVYEASSSIDKTVPTEARASLERLLSSEAIQRAPRLRLVLKFMIDALLDGRAETINEQIIGEAVLDRPKGYNPSEDNIVRVTIRHLRDRIDDFYRTEGRNEKYALKIPKGRYVPILVRQPPEEAVTPSDFQEPAASVTMPEELSGPVGMGTAPIIRGWTLVLPWVLVVLLAVTAIFLGFRLHELVYSRQAPQQKGFLSFLLANGEPTTVVVTDSTLEAYRMIFQKTVSLDAYLDRSYLHSVPAFSGNTQNDGVWNYLGASGQTSVTSMIVSCAIQEASEPHVISLKYPHSLNMRDIEHGNYIFLGGPWINPWVQLFENRLNFRIVPLPDEPWGASIHNMNPLSGEPAIFASHREGPLMISYVRVALLKNQSNDGYIVLLSGTTDEAVEAGERFFMSEPWMKELLKSLHIDSPEKLPSIEILIETAGLQGVPQNSRIVAKRFIDAP